MLTIAGTLALMSCLVQLVLLGIGAKWLAITFPFLLIVFYLFQRLYLRTSSQLRLLEMEAKSPLYRIFSDCVTGLATIRSFGTQHNETAALLQALDDSQRPFYALYCAQRWGSLVINLSIAAMAIILIGVASAADQERKSGYFGVAFVNLMSFSSNIKMLMTWWTMLETALGAVQRIREYSATMREMSREQDEANTFDGDWPEHGAIDFKDVSVRYG